MELQELVELLAEGTVIADLIKKYISRLTTHLSQEIHVGISLSGISMGLYYIEDLNTKIRAVIDENHYRP